ncbi:MAG: MATE family efflux transporter [Clostridia bacterium]|nr:MATE family efflux transporter [Clostridia bacterium]
MSENRNDVMGTMPVGKLLFTTAVPMMVSMLVQACYNIVDSLFVSRVSEQALNAVSLAFPLQTLMIGFGIGTAVGTNALMSRYLGAKDQENADRAANTGILLSLLTGLLFAVIGLTCSGWFFNVLTDNEVIRNYGRQYCMICLTFSVGFFLQSTFERMLTATGRSKLAMICQLSGAITNIILDPVFIFGLGPAPRLEVAGAAVATVIGQWVAAGLAMVLVVKKVPEIHPDPKKLKFHVPTVRAIYRIGIPSIVMQCISSVMNFGMNMILISFTETATAVFGVYYKLQSFIFMPVFGLNTGMIPIISYNYGARKPDRLWNTVKIAIITSVGIMIAGTILFLAIPGPLLSIFNASDTMLSIGVRALRIISIHFPLAGFCIIAGSVFQSVGEPNHSVICSLCRQLVVLLPGAWILGKLGGLDAVWFAFPLAELVSLLLSVIFMIKTVRSVRKQFS